MKNLKYILIATIFMFVGINGVSAANVEKSCSYFKDGKLIVGLQINDDGTATGLILDENYTGSTKVIPVNNWPTKKSIYETNNKCPNFAVINYDTSIPSMSVSDDESELSGPNKTVGVSNEYDEEGFTEILEDMTSDDAERTCLYESNDKKTKIEVQFKKVTLLGFDLGINPIIKVPYLNDAQPETNSGSFANWLDKESIYKNSPKCFGYGLVYYYDKGRYSDNYYYAASTIEEAMEIYNQHTGDPLKKNLTIVSLIEDSKVPIADNNDDIDNPSEYEIGCDIFGDTIVEIIKRIYGYFKWIIPVLIIILSMLDFVKVVGTGKDDDFKKAQNNLIKRIILGVVFFLVPTLISFIINFSGITEQFTNGESIWSAVTCILE